MKSHFSQMAKYNTWANARLYEMARGLPDKLYRKNVGAFFGSLHGTLNHLLVTDRIWMRRFTGIGDDHPNKLNAILFEDLPSLELARRDEDERIVQYVDGLTDSGISRDLDYSTTSGTPQPTKRTSRSSIQSSNAPSWPGAHDSHSSGYSRATTTRSLGDAA